MSRLDYGDKTRGLVLGLLTQNLSYSVIISKLKEQQISVSKSYISKLKTGSGKVAKKSISTRKVGRPAKLTKVQLSRLRKKLLRPNPPTITQLSRDFGLSRVQIIYWRDKKFRLKKYRKRRVHALTERARQQRRSRSWPLYMALRKNKWMKWITSDEKTFVLWTCNDKSEIYYREPDDNRSPLTLPRTPQGAKGLMVWAAICAKGKSKLYFIPPKTKVNSSFYINRILKTFMKDD